MWGSLVAFEVWDLATPVQIRASPCQKNKMTSKLKKTRSAGRFGVRYGKRPRSSVIAIENKQRKKQICPFCGKKGVKKISKGIWQCTRKKCGKKFASDIYYLEQ